MTASSPFPCGCIPDHPACDCDIRTHREQGRRDRDDVGTAGGQLRAKIELAIMGRTATRAADAVLALPALRDLIAERDTLAAQVQAVEGLAATWESDAKRHDDAEPIDSDGLTRMILAARFLRMNAADIRRALGTPTTEARP